MDLALAIFNVGAGLGVLAAGLSLAYLAWRATPLIRESRALTADLRRLAITTDTELGPILASARELTRNVEVLSEDVAVKLDQLSDLMSALQRSLDAGQVTAAAPRVEWQADGREAEPVEGPELWPVEPSEAQPTGAADLWPADGSEPWPVEGRQTVPQARPEPEPWSGERRDPWLDERFEPWPEAVPQARSEPLPVESWQTREDPSDP